MMRKIYAIKMHHMRQRGLLSKILFNKGCTDMSEYQCILQKEYICIC